MASVTTARAVVMRPVLPIGPYAATLAKASSSLGYAGEGHAPYVKDWPASAGL
jgi:hypothetical protein